MATVFERNSQIEREREKNSLNLFVKNCIIRVSEGVFNGQQVKEFLET